MVAARRLDLTRVIRGWKPTTTYNTHTKSIDLLTLSRLHKSLMVGRETSIQIKYQNQHVQQIHLSIDP